MKLPFQAVAVRYVHDVLTGEFLNVGTVLLCPGHHFVGARFIPQWSRVTAAFPAAELPQLRRMASSIETACAQAMPSVQLPLSMDTDVTAFIGRVIPPDDASVQLSPVIRGITDDPQRTLQELHRRYAERYLPEEATRAPRNENDVWQSFARRLAGRADLASSLTAYTLSSPRLPRYQYEFERAWKNGKWNIAQPVSFDLIEPRAIREKATQWTGRVITLQPAEQDVQMTLLVGMPPDSVAAPIREAAADALQILGQNLANEVQVLTEDRSDELAEKIVRDLGHAD